MATDEKEIEDPYYSLDQNTGDKIAGWMAEQSCMGFRHHDADRKEAAVEAFFVVDRNQFEHLGYDEALEAARNYVEALWEKDRLEERCIVDGEKSVEMLEEADWSGVKEHLRQRGDLVFSRLDFSEAGNYAEKSTAAWKNHKTDRDYWTPLMDAQVSELQAALQRPDYPEKPSDGQAGHAPEASRYALAVELHDMHTEHHWKQAVQVMTPYYRKTLETRE